MQEGSSPVIELLSFLLEQICALSIIHFPSITLKEKSAIEQQDSYANIIY